MECMIFIYLPPLFLSQIQIVASKLAEARYIPFGDQSTKRNNQNKHLFQFLTEIPIKAIVIFFHSSTDIKKQNHQKLLCINTPNSYSVWKQWTRRAT